MNIKSIMSMAAVAAGLAAVAVTASSASAIGAKDYQSALEGAGYKVGVSASAVPHTTLHAQGVLMNIDKGGKGASLELLDYNGNRDALKTDWIVENGSGPRPRVATSDFAGRVLYWNDDSVLAIDFRDPNFREAAQAAGEIFLGRRGTGGPATGAAPATSAPGTKLPSTGTGSGGTRADLGDFLLPVALLGAGGVLLAASVGGVVRRRRG